MNANSRPFVNLILQILSYVGWEDLVSLAHTNLFFQLYLTDPRSTIVWQNARHAYNDFLVKIPEPPVGIPEYVLAFFILRPTCCVVRNLVSSPQVKAYRDLRSVTVIRISSKSTCNGIVATAKNPCTFVSSGHVASV